MFIAKRDRQYSVVQDVRKCEASYEYMVSDNPACAGRFLCEEPHDNSNISRCEAEANKLKKKVETIKDTIAAHRDGGAYFYVGAENERRRREFVGESGGIPPENFAECRGSEIVFTSFSARYFLK